MKNLDKNCRICMEWQEHYYWNHMADDKKHFFKPMVGDFTETMSIPARFANNFNGHISEVISLKSPSGKTWSIGVGSNTDEVVLESGWKEFVSAHSIDQGDCMLFKYTGVSSFDVLVFDSSGCEKTWPHFTHNSNISSHGYERIESSVRLDEQGPRLGCRRFKGGQDCTCTPQSLYGGGGNDDDDEDDAHLELALHKNTNRSIPKRCKRKLYSDIELAAHGEVKDDDDDDEEDAHLELTLHKDTSRSIPKRCKRKLYSDIELAAPGEVKDDDDDDDDDVERTAKTGYYFCKNGPVSEYHLTEQDREEISSIRVPVEPRNPVFVQVMHPTHLRSNKPGVVGISSEFADKYLGTSSRDVILERGGSKGKWHVRYNRNRFCRGLTGRGWSQFVGDNGLLAHDICLFELMMNGKRRPAVTVHVLRKVRGAFVLLP